MSENKKLVKNSIFLYGRQILTLIINLYVVRLLLKYLGETDYGIFNVVGGVVAVVSFISSTFASSVQRYLAYDMGKMSKKIRETFSLSVIVFSIIAALFVLCIEPIGYWMLNYHMTIPSERLFAANIVLQMAIYTFVINILRTSYTAYIIADENIFVYSLIGVIEVLLKLCFVLLIPRLKYDSLILYSLVVFFTSIFGTFIFVVYCIRKYEACRFLFIWDKKRISEMLSFAGWNVIGTFSNVLRSQGLNVMMNIFFTPAVNAARGISYQVNSSLNNLTSNFYTALRPQIIKNYATDNKERLRALVNQGAKFAFFVFFIASQPILYSIDFILKTWLVTPPDYTSLFVRIMIITSLIEVVNQPLVSLVQASGRIKQYQLVVSVIYLLNLPLSYILYKMKFGPEAGIMINAMLVVVSFLPRLYICSKVAGLKVKEYLSEVIVPILKVVLFSNAVIYLIVHLLNMEMPSLLYLLVIFVITVFSCLLLGCSKREKNLIIGMIYKLKK